MKKTPLDFFEHGEELGKVGKANLGFVTRKLSLHWLRNYEESGKILLSRRVGLSPYVYLIPTNVVYKELR